MMKNFEPIGNNYAISSYDLAHKIGRGAFADVYRCKKLTNGIPNSEIYVAKEVHFQRNIPNMKELIIKEIELMLTLTGTNDAVVKIFDFFESKKPGDMYIIMENCEGGDLDKYVEESGPLPENEIVDLLYPVAEFFAKLHRQGIIHRDLKLANILLGKKIVKGEKPCIKVTDFGLAHIMGAEEMAHTTCGTPLYMAPEIWSRDAKGYTSKIDVWSFGNLFYKMMYGEYVFEDIQVEKKVKEGIIRFPKLRLTSLEALDLMLKCFRKDPKTRITFDEIVNHPFFMKKKFNIFDKIFDGYFGYFETNINNTYDLLKNPLCLPIPVDEPNAFDIHNEEILNQYLKSQS